MFIIISQFLMSRKLYIIISIYSISIKVEYDWASLMNANVLEHEENDYIQSV